MCQAERKKSNGRADASPSPLPLSKLLALCSSTVGVGSGYQWPQFLGWAVPKRLLLWSGEQEYPAPPKCTSPCHACAMLPGTWELRCHLKVGRSQRTSGTCSQCKIDLCIQMGKPRPLSNPCLTRPGECVARLASDRSFPGHLTWVPAYMHHFREASPVTPAKAALPCLWVAFCEAQTGAEGLITHLFSWRASSTRVGEMGCVPRAWHVGTAQLMPVEH